MLICEGIFHRNPTKCRKPMPYPHPTFSATFRRMRFGKKWFPSPPKNGPFRGPLPQGNGLGSISCGDYDFQEGVLSSRCFGWTPGPFHQRRKNRTDSGRVLICRGWGCDAKCDAKNVVNRPRWAEV